VVNFIQKYKYIGYWIITPRIIPGEATRVGSVWVSVSFIKVNNPVLVNTAGIAWPN